jgi:hypothetical protein
LVDEVAALLPPPPDPLPPGDLDVATNRVKAIDNIPVVLPPISAFSDEFNGAVVDASKWTTISGASVADGSLRLDNEELVQSGAKDISSGLVMILKIGNVGNGVVHIHDGTGKAYTIGYFINGSGLIRISVNFGSHYEHGVSAANIATAAYLRFRLTGANAFLDKSPNGEDWTQCVTAPLSAGINLAACQIQILSVANGWSIDFIRTNIGALGEKSLIWFNQSTLQYESATLPALKTALDAIV